MPPLWVEQRAPGLASWRAFLLGSCPGIPSVHGSATLSRSGNQEATCPWPQSWPPASRSPPPGAPGSCASGVHRAVTSLSTGQTMEGSSGQVINWNRSNNPGHAALRLRPCLGAECHREVQPGAGVPAGGPAGGTAGPPAQPRTHSLCSLGCGHRAPRDALSVPPYPTLLLPLNQGWRGSLPRRCDPTAGRWGLVVSQEQHEAAAPLVSDPPRGLGFPQSSGEGPGDMASSLGGRPDAGCHCCCVCWPRGRGAAGRTQRPLCRVGCQGLGRLRPPAVPAAVPGLRWPSTCALRSSSGSWVSGRT